MKKKLIISLCGVLFLVVVGIVTMLVFMLKPSENYIKNKEYVESYSKIENFIDYKTDKDMLVVKNRRKNDSAEDSNYDYHIDENDELYMIIKEIDYEEVAQESNLSALYDIDYVAKDSKKGDKQYNYCSRDVTICTDNIIRIYCSREGAPWDGVSKNRYYKMNDNDYNKLLEKIDYILENNALY